MDSVVNFFILLLIFVFDPLAISLVIATNISIQREFGTKEPEPKKEIEPVNVEPEEEKVESEPLSEIQEDESQKKADEVVRYVADEKGEFKPIATPVIADENKEKINKIIMDQIKAQGIEHNASYLSFLDVLFKNGTAQVGQLLPLYGAFLEEIKASGLTYTEKEVKDFLTICNLFKITDMSGPDRKIAKDYPVAKEIISLLSK